MSGSKTKNTKKNKESAIAPALLAWYDRHRRELPWRARPGEQADPYAVWLSEIMLQQTTVATVGPYFRKFLARWPDIHALAAAGLDEVLHAWAGLGYYSRARNLHKCARQVAAELSGEFPSSAKELEDLPGIGPYTAAAIAAIAFDEPATVVDGNVERVVARLFEVETPLPKAKPELRRRAATLTPETRPGDFAQAMMDLGATICSPRAPACTRCPLEALCAARAAGSAETLPRRAPKAPKPTRRGLAFWIENERGEVLLRRRPEKGLLGGMMEVPSSPWERAPQTAPAPSSADAEKADSHEALQYAPAVAAGAENWRILPGFVRHTFTHFHLELAVADLKLAGAPAPEGEPGAKWVAPADFAAEALPTVMRKVIDHARPELGPLFAASKTVARR